MNQIPVRFPITIFENIAEESISDTITKKRCGIFYKGRNRNGSYISDEFAESLIKTLPYAPVKGIYDEEDEDFTTHGTKRSEGRIYGVVPSEQEMNFAWEKQLDSDGVEREYCCVDVYLYTALYKEANEIDGKGQSMELYPPSIEGEWVNINGTSTFKYSKASFLGLQVLGDNAVPCFEGSSFFSLFAKDGHLYTLFTTLLEKINELSRGDEKMENNKDMIREFELSARQAEDEISKVLNKGKFRYIVMDHYTEYAIVYDLEEDVIKKFNYTVGEDNAVTIDGEPVILTCEYVTAEEKTALDALRTKTEATSFTDISNKIDTMNQQISDYQTEINDKTNEIATLMTKNENEVNALTEQLTALKEFKEQVEIKEKEALINKFSVKLSEEIVEEYRSKIGEFTLSELKQSLAVALVDSDESLFTVKDPDSKDPAPAGFVPQESQSKLVTLLNKYKNNGGN